MGYLPNTLNSDYSWNKEHLTLTAKNKKIHLHISINHIPAFIICGVCKTLY